MKLNTAVLVSTISLVLLSGCGEDQKDVSLTDGTKNAANGIQDASAGGFKYMPGSEKNGSSMYPNAGIGPEFSDPNNPLSKSTIYFMLDSSQVQEDFVPVIAAHAQYLVAHPDQRVIVQGHGDERGSPEYNIALGEQRAKSVASMLKAQGVVGTQLDIVSYGEEKPVAFGHDEASWELNRRVELVYQGK